MKEKLGVSNKFRRFQDMERKIKYANGVLEPEDESTDEEPVHDPTAERDGWKGQLCSPLATPVVRGWAGGFYLNVLL